MEKNNVKSFFKKFWFLLWKDKSLKGWIFSVVFLFVFIKFIFFPVLSVVTGTALPLAIVESCSMYHQGNLFSNFNTWWSNHDEKYSEFQIEKEDFSEFIMKNGFNKGDILFITGADPEKIEVGDVIIFSANQINPIIHRVIEIREENNKKIFSTIGDNNNGQFTFERSVTEEQLVGKASAKIAPYLGWIKLVFYNWQKPPSERGLCIEN